MYLRIFGSHMAEDANTGIRTVVGASLLNREFHQPQGDGISKPPACRDVFFLAMMIGLIGGFAIGELFAKALPTPLQEALEIVTDILDTEFERALNQRQSNRAQPDNQLCEEHVKNLVKKIRDRTIKKVKEKIQELQGRKPAECELCREPVIALPPCTSHELMPRERW